MPQLWWPFKSKNSATTVNVTRSSEPDSRHSQRLVIILAGVLLALGLWAALALWLPGTRGTLEVGSPSPVTIQAPRSTEFVSDVRTAEAQAQAENRSENIVYTTDRNLPTRQRQELVSLMDTISSIRNDPSLSSLEKRQELVSYPSASVVISDTVADAVLSLNDGDWRSVTQKTLDFYDRALAENEGAIDEEALQLLHERSLPFWASDLPQPQRDLVLLFTKSFLRVNRTVDQEATEQRKREARAEVDPVFDQVQEGENIVLAGEIVSWEMIEKLEAVGALPKRLSWLDMLGYAVISSLLSLITMIYLSFLQRPIVEQPRALFVIIGLIILTAGAARLLLPIWANYAYVFPMATIVLVLTVVFNGHLALAITTLLAIVIGILGDNSIALMIVMMTGSVVGIFSVRGAERPLTFIVAGFTIALATAATQLGNWLITTTDIRWQDVQMILFFSSTNGALSAIMALGLFNLVGHIAGVVTPLQLMELAHPSQPLIRKVVREAPGTYYHSVSVGNLAEAAAEAVGADALLLRVAAYYHDIGKTIRPYFFTDNQTGRENVHNDLDPQTSAAIIIDHVREGVKMAHAAGLPQPIIDFISTHHGTSVVGHFYQLALREQDTVDIEDFRYPGPKPFTKEQGIMMLSDSVEATVRAKAQHGLLVAKPANGAGNGKAQGGAQTIDELVGSIIEDRVRSGQLDNTSLTLHDLVVIRETFVTSLQGIYHPRVEYAPQVVKS